MEVVANNFMPGDSRLVEQLVYELKSQGIFDRFRKECISDVDTKPAYQNLRQRVEGSVSTFLRQQTWSPDMNKNQVREQLRKNIYESGYLETGVERIVDQVVNPKINTIFLPEVEDVVYRFLGVVKPVRDIKKEVKINIADLLPTDLEAVSPESVHSFKDEVKPEDHSETLNDSLNSGSKPDEDESPPFEPLDPANKITNEENSVDSHLSGFSGLQSHGSNHSGDNRVCQMEISNQDSQVSHNSSESRLSIITSEETTKMDICDDFSLNLMKSATDKTPTETLIQSKMDVDEIMPCDETDTTGDFSMEESLSSSINRKENESSSDNTFKVDKSENETPGEKTDENKSDKKQDKSIEKKSKSSDRYSKDKRDDKYRKSSSGSSKDVSFSKYSSSKDRDRNRKDSKSSSSVRDKEKTDKSREKTDRDKEKKDKGKDKTEKQKTDRDVEKSANDKEKFDKDRSSGRDKDRSDKSTDKSEREKLDKDRAKTEKSSRDKDKERDKSDKDKERSDKEKERSDKERDRSDKEKERSDKEKDRSDKEKDRSERDRSDKEKERSDKEKDKANRDKDKSDKERSSKDKDKSAKHREKSDKEKTDKHKDKYREKDKYYKEKSSKEKETPDKEKSSDSKTSSKNKNDRPSSSSKKEEKPRSSNSSSSRDKSKLDNGDTKSRSSTDKSRKESKHSMNGKSSSSSSDQKKDKDKKRDSKKQLKDDHYSSKDKKNDRRSTDRDSNDGHSSKPNFSGSCSENNSSRSEKSSQEFTSNSGSGDSGNSDQVEQSEPARSEEPAPVQQRLIKPKFASNFQEMRKIMKIRKQLALLEKQKRLGFTHIESQVLVKNGLPGKGKASWPVKQKKVTQKRPYENKKKQVDGKENVHEENDIEESVRLGESLELICEEVVVPQEAEISLEQCTEEIRVETPESPWDSTSLRSTELSQENWEALEARLAQEMATVNCNSYESDEEVIYSASPRKTESVEAPETKADVALDPHSSSSESEDFSGFPAEECSSKSLEFLRSLISEKLRRNPVLISVGSEVTREGSAQNSDSKQLSVVLDKNDMKKNNHRLEPATENCRFLEKPTAFEEANLRFLNEFIGKLEEELRVCMEAKRSSTQPVKRGRKRKFEEIVDAKNNNRDHYEQIIVRKRGRPPGSHTVLSKVNKEKLCNTTDLLTHEKFSLPLSPAESDKSNDKKEEELLIPVKRRRIIATQRYSSDDLYKPRPIFCRRNKDARKS